MVKWKTALKKLWWFIWEDDSLASWIVNIVLAFILIKFIVYPGLGLVFGTSYPVVAVVSGSMEHDGSFDTWWQSQAYCATGYCTQEEWYAEQSITKDQFKRFIFPNGFNTGDIIVLIGKDPQKIKVGDVIVFQSDKPYPIIHRVITKRIETGKVVFNTKGDHNAAKGPDDTEISEERLIGKAIFRIPYLGWIKIVFFKAVGYVWLGVQRVIGV
jgi:signal peptidase I